MTAEESHQSTAERPKLECDMIMKGGITSGVVYPGAVNELSRTYRFRGIGGTSAGAIAAAGAAAAEYGRARGGFDKLAALPPRIGRELANLFQPSPRTRHIFDAAMQWVEPNRCKTRRVLGTVWIAIVDRFFSFFVSLVVTLILGSLAALIVAEFSTSWGLIAGGVIAFVFALAASALVACLCFVRFVLREVPRNNFGICDGQTADAERGGGVPPLTEWLAAVIDDLAGLDSGKGPLTFGHLWGEEAVQAYCAASPNERLPASRQLRELREIDLEVMTTNLGFGRPHRLPFDEGTFMWCRTCLSRYFPGYVIEHMTQNTEELADLTRAGHNVPYICPDHRERLRRFPAAPDLPVVVAARMSLSFPFLISAVPLFVVDWSRAPGKQGVERVWFSDGGISSNFPMNFFDSLWPRRPTFGIDLQSAHPDYPNRVWRSSGVRSGIAPRVHALASVGDFVAAIMDTMQNWADRAQVSMPGFRDRVAVVYLAADEGGLNLRMSADTIQRLSERGAEAANTLTDFEFDSHRWVRYRIAMSELSSTLSGMLDSYQNQSPAGGSYEQFVKSHVSRHYPPGQPTDQWRASDRTATEQLMTVAAQWMQAGEPARKETMPRPRPVLRVTPR